MPRRERRSAGADVLALARGLSDDLLVLEEKAFGQIDALFVAYGVDALVACQNAAARSGLATSLKGGAGTKRVMSFATKAAESAQTVATVMLAEASQMALDSIAQELAICESTLSPTYAGCADEGVAAAKTMMDAEMALALSTVNASIVDALTWMQSQSERQVTATVTLEEPAEVLWNRLFNEKPNRIAGLSGRGVWWQMPSTLHATLRGAEFRMVNSTRNTAMRGMNAAGASRG